MKKSLNVCKIKFHWKTQFMLDIVLCGNNECYHNMLLKSTNKIFNNSFYLYTYVFKYYVIDSK